MRNLSFLRQPLQCLGFPGSSAVKKNPLANAEKAIDSGLIPGSGRCARGGNGNPIQCFCLGNQWTEESGGLQSTMGLQSLTRLSDLAHTSVFGQLY